ncbi:hypothetical protein [Phyllobacterium sophorae]|uniref:Uncharacterized protein n=1 Tax=Phyllobacterium sophorae TaxID=1520277 RepID=A0A2P7BDV1_9HYPH|nr:hypothetical protein [Phyllobacterium sophorae]PSH64654.1 hypothetical protein CU103_12285 [Phyllobacterium sophorae]
MAGIFDFLFGSAEETPRQAKVKKTLESQNAIRAKNKAAREEAEKQKAFRDKKSTALPVIDPEVLVQEQAGKGRPIVNTPSGGFMADIPLLNDYRQSESRAARDSGFAYSNNPKAEAAKRIMEEDALSEQMEEEEFLRSAKPYTAANPKANEIKAKVDAARARKEKNIQDLATQFGTAIGSQTPVAEEPNIWDKVLGNLPGAEYTRTPDAPNAGRFDKMQNIPDVAAPNAAPQAPASPVPTNPHERRFDKMQDIPANDAPATTGAVDDDINNLILGGIFAPSGTQLPEEQRLRQEALTKQDGRFPDAPKVTGNESFTPQSDYLDNAPRFPAAPNASAENPFKEEKQPFFDFSVIGAALANLDPRFPDQGNALLQRIDARRKLQMGQKELIGQQRATYDWLTGQGMSAAEAEAMARNPELLKEFIDQKNGGGSGGAGGYFAGIERTTDANGTVHTWQRRKDTGEWEEVNLPGQTVRTPEEEERLKREGGAYGKGQGESLLAFDKVNSDTGAALGELNILESHPGIDNSTGLLDGMASMNNIAVTPEGRDFLSRVDKVVNGSFLTAFNSLRGGGQITEAEGQKAQGALQRLQNYTLSPKDWLQALNEYKAEVSRLHKIAARRASMPPEQARQDALKAAESGPTPTNIHVSPGTSAAQGQPTAPQADGKTNYKTKYGLD